MSLQTQASPLRAAVQQQPDDLDYDKGRRRFIVWLVVLWLVLLASVPVTVAMGPADLNAWSVLRVLCHHLTGFPEATWTVPVDTIVWDVRAPRVLLSIAVGACLAVGGVVLQALVRNVLAEPYLLGISSGASTGAAATILLGVGVGTGAVSLAGSAFLGALVATAFVFALARHRGRVTSIRLLLAGVAVGYVLSAATSFLIFASDSPEGIRAVLFWLLGSMSRATWLSVAVVGSTVVAAIAIMLFWSRGLDALSIGDDTAHALGYSPGRLRVWCLIVVAGSVSAAVATSGGIGFIGLVVPHVARLCVGGVHRTLLPIAALLGGIILLWADACARTIFDPRELPVGIVTAVVGAPFLFFLVRKMQGQTAT